MYYSYHYVIDWDKVKTLDDMKLVVETLAISYEPNDSRIDKIMHLVVKEDKAEFVGYLSAAEEPPAESE